MNTKRRLFPYLLLAAPALLALGRLYERRADRRDGYPLFQPAHRRVDIGGRRLYARVEGQRQPGQPLVVLEAGHSDWSKCWKLVQPEIARFTRVLAYDRAGAGWSDPGTLPYTPLGMVVDLHRLLQSLDEPGPYLLVGHSMGGPLARLFYARYPQEVAGIIWVDSAHEHMERYLSFFYPALLGMLGFYRVSYWAAWFGLARLFPRLMLPFAPDVHDPPGQSELMAQVVGTRYFKWVYAETAGFAHPDAWGCNPQSLGALPVCSVEAQYNTQRPPSVAKLFWREFLTGWRQIQEDLAGLSTHLRRIPADAGHVVMLEKPAVVVSAVRDMLVEIGG